MSNFESSGISSELVEPYQLNLKTVNQQIEVKHGALQRAFLMQKVSCGSFTDVSGRCAVSFVRSLNVAAARV